jgi:hypothetical protein
VLHECVHQRKDMPNLTEDFNLVSSIFGGEQSSRLECPHSLTMRWFSARAILHHIAENRANIAWNLKQGRKRAVLLIHQSENWEIFDETIVKIAKSSLNEI